MWNKNGWCKKTLLSALTLLILVPVSVLAADDEDDNGDTTTKKNDSPGHWYVGGSTGYLKPDFDRQGGNTRTLGLQGGYQFNDRWSIDLGDQHNAFGPGDHHLEMHSLSLTRYWGSDVRFLMEYGYTHITLVSNYKDNATAGFHIGAGLSTFVTDNWELRGDLKFVHTMAGGLNDGIGTLSLNYHFVEPKPAVQEEGSVLGASDNESLPPMEYRESEEPVAATPAPAPEPVAPPAPAVAVPKFTHTLVNFGFNSVNIEAQYGSQLDQISEEIKSTNSKAVIEGHTDSVGSDKSNKVLSMDRAIVVKRELKKRGVEGADLQVVGYGEEHPVATNDTEEGRKQNRRVEVKVYDK